MEESTLNVGELIFALGGLGTIIAIFVGVMLLLFLPFYVAGIYNRVVKCQKELEKINQFIGNFEIERKIGL